MDLLPSWGTLLFVSLLIFMFAGVWILQGISMETLSAMIRLYVQGRHLHWYKVACVEVTCHPSLPKTYDFLQPSLAALLLPNAKTVVSIVSTVSIVLRPS